jgi:hypothetical protein
MYTKAVPMNKGTLEYAIKIKLVCCVLNVLYVDTVDKIKGYHRS